MPQVLNKKIHGVPKGAVYVGRPSKWGNPFQIGRDGDRDEVVTKFTQWFLMDSGLLGDLDELVGKDLVCWCAPERCHAEILLRLAELVKEGRECSAPTADSLPK
jgi:hypothetical protein